MLNEEFLSINLNIDNYTAPKKEELLYKLDLYFDLINRLSTYKNIDLIKEYEYLQSLIYLESSVFDNQMVSIPLFGTNIYDEISKYNVWYRTKKLIDSLGDDRIVFTKEDGKRAVVKVMDTVISEYSFDSKVFTMFKPNIVVNCYENKDEYKKDKMFLLVLKYMKLKAKLTGCSIVETLALINDLFIDKIDPVLLKHMELNENFCEVSDILKTYKENLPRYNNPLYKDIAYLLLDEYNMKNDKGKSYVKIGYSIDIRRKSY